MAAMAAYLSAKCKRLWYLRSSLMLRRSYKTPYRGRNNSSVAGNSNATFLSTFTTRRNNGQAIPPSDTFSFVTTISRVPFELRDGPIARSKDSALSVCSFFFLVKWIIVQLEKRNSNSESFRSLWDVSVFHSAIGNYFPAGQSWLDVNRAPLTTISFYRSSKEMKLTAEFPRERKRKDNN